jgi:hypothetical protein
MVTEATPGNRRKEDYFKDKPDGKGTDTTVIYDKHVGKIFRSPQGPAKLAASNGEAGVFNDSLGVSGSITLVHRDKDGHIKSQETLENVITYVGLEYISKLVSGAAVSPFRYIQIGTGAHDPLDPLSILAPDPTNTALIAFYKEMAAVVSNVVVTNDADRGYQAISRFACTFDFTEPVHINEACISVDSHIVNLTPILNRRTFFDRVMQIGDFLEFVWEISFTRYPKDKVS